MLRAVSNRGNTRAGDRSTGIASMTAGGVRLWKKFCGKTLQKMPRSGFARSLGMLLAGSLAGQAIVVVVSPIITRLYSPKDFGLMGVYASLLSILTVSSMFRYDAAIPAADTDEDALYLLILCGFAALASSLLLAIAFLVSGRFAMRFGAVRLLWPYRYLLALGMFSTGLYLSLSYWAVRFHDFAVLSRVKITQGAAMAATQLGLAILQMGPAGLILGQIVGQSSGTGTILKRLINTHSALVRNPHLHELKGVVVRYRRFPILSMPASLMEAASSNLPLVFMATVYSDTVAGWITLVQRIVLLPLALLSRSITQVVFGEFAAMKRDSPERMRRAYQSRLKQLMKLSLPAAACMGILAPLVIPAMFGTAWNNSVFCLEVLIPLTAVSFVATPFGCVLDVLERQDLHLLRDFLRLLLTLTSLGVVYWLKMGWRQSLAVISFAGCLGSVMYLWISWIGIRDYAVLPAVTTATPIESTVALMTRHYGLTTLIRYAFPVVRHNHMFRVDLESHVSTAPALCAEYHLSFPCDNPLVDSVEALGLDATALREFRAAGELLGVILKGGSVVHRSLVQAKGSVRLAGDRKAYSLAPGEAYIHHCETAQAERGKGLYPAMLITVLNRLQLRGMQRVYIACEQSNIASIRGILKAGFQFDRSALSLSVLWGRLHHSFWYRSSTAALKG